MTPKLNGLKQCTFFLLDPVSVSQKSGSSLAGCSDLGPLWRLKSRYWPGLQSCEDWKGAGGCTSKVAHFIPDHLVLVVVLRLLHWAA